MALSYTAPVLQELNVRLVTAFEDGAMEAAAAASEVLDLCQVETSDTSANIYTVASKDFSLYQRGRGEATYQATGVNVYERKLENGSFVRGINIDADDFDDDKIGKVAALFYTVGMTVGVGPSEMVEDVILEADTDSYVGHDAVPFWSQSHPRRPFQLGTELWSNDLVLAGGLTFANFETALAHMSSYPREDSNPDGTARSIGAYPTIVVVGPKFEGIGMDICSNDYPRDFSGGKNPWVGKFRLMVVRNWGKDYNRWYLFDTRFSRERPLVFQERRPLRTVPLHTSPDDPQVIKSRKYEWAIEGRVKAGVGHPGRALRVRPS